MTSSKDLIRILMELKNAKYAKVAMPYVGIKPGLYGEGDKLLGIKMPVIRNAIKDYVGLPLNEVSTLVCSEYHEIRMAAVLILLHQYKKSGGKKEEKRLFEFYIDHVNKYHINNWDMVDVSAPHLVGHFLFQKTDHGRSVLLDYTTSHNLWMRRVAIVATFYHIRQGSFDVTMALAKTLLNDEHHLVHKGVGWMIREVGKRNEMLLTDFLDEHHENMPRIMVSYSVEKLSRTKKKSYSKK